MPSLTEIMTDAFRATLRAIDPVALTAEAVERLDIDGPVRIVAVGKAASGMTQGAMTTLGDQVESATVVTNQQVVLPSPAEVWVGAHPFPDESSVAAGRAMLQAAESVAPDETLVVLVSGGGSSLAEVPPPGLTVGMISATARHLMHAGVPIDALNTIRRHVSDLKNGQLLDRVTQARRVVTLLISDVIDGPPSEIASGPTIADGSRRADALAVLAEHDLLDSVPAEVVAYLRQSQSPDLVPVAHHVEVIADRHTAAQAAATHLGSMGASAQIVQRALSGAATDMAAEFCRISHDHLTIATGETTVVVTGSGRGGRNQTAALAAALALEGGAPTTFGAFATDGVDGPTDAAGAVVDQTTATRIRDAGISPELCLRDNDAYRALDAARAIVRTGPTGTNVADIWMIARGN